MIMFDIYIIGWSVSLFVFTWLWLRYNGNNATNIYHVTGLLLMSVVWPVFLPGAVTKLVLVETVARLRRKNERSKQEIIDRIGKEKAEELFKRLGL